MESGDRALADESLWQQLQRGDWNGRLQQIEAMGCFWWIKEHTMASRGKGLTLVTSM